MSGGYGYERRSYNMYNGVAPVADKWKNSDYTESDHVARQQPYIPSTESYVVNSERIVEKVVTPTVIEYSRVSPVTYGVERNRWGTSAPSALDDRPRKVEEFITQVQTEVSKPQPQRLKSPPRFLSKGARPDYKHGSYPTSEYGQPESDAWSRSSSPIRAPLADYKHGSNSGKYGGQGNTWGSRPSIHVPDSDQTQSSPIGRGYLGNKSRVPEPAPVAEYQHSSMPISPLKNHTTENNPWARNSRPGLLGSSDWRQKPSSTYPTTQSAQTGYGSYNDYKTSQPDHVSHNDYKTKEKDKERPGGYSYHYDDKIPRNYTSEKYKNIATEPSPQLARGAWTRPGLGSWAPTTTQVTTLSRPNNNINEAVNYLTGALQQSSLTHAPPQKQYYNTLGHPEMDHYRETIDSMEAQSRYGNMNGSSIVTESYGPTIDSNEALRRYGGAAV